MQSENKIRVRTLAPVLFAFFVMGFCDLVGVSVTYAKEQFHWSETQAGFLPSMVFFWFLILSIPVAVLVNRWNRKTIVLFSMIFTLSGMLVPILAFNETMCYVAFILLGIGNTIQQVSLNPLVSNVVSPDRFTSSLTAGNFIKALSSLSGPIIAGFCFTQFGRWEITFIVYAAITLVSFIWLAGTKISEESRSSSNLSFAGTWGLLANKEILTLFLGIVFVVGVDVGMNILTPKLLMERVSLAEDAAGYGSSWYFLARTLGTFCGIFILSRVNETKYFRVNMVISLLAISGLFFVSSYVGIIGLVATIAFAASCVFAVIFSKAIMVLPQKTNEISGLMITGIAGGAIIPPTMGLMADYIGSQIGSVIVVALCIVYLLWCSLRLRQ